MLSPNTHKIRQRPMLRAFPLFHAGLIGFLLCLLWRYLVRRSLRKGKEQSDIAVGKWTPTLVPKYSESVPDYEGIDDSQTHMFYHFRFGSFESCTPDHWHRSYRFKFIEVKKNEEVEQQGLLYAVVQHTETKRYHLMLHIDTSNVSCDHTNGYHEVFALLIQGNYEHFVFLPNQNINGFVTAAYAREAVHALPDTEEVLKFLLSVKAEDEE